MNVDAFDFAPNTEASYRVKIEGRLLDAGEVSPDLGSSGEQMSSGEEGHAASTNNSEPKDETSQDSRSRLSHFFKALSVDFDRSRFRNGAEQSVEWKKPDSSTKTQHANAADFDELTFKRNGDENMNITINLYRQESPDRYQLSPELAEVVDMSESTQQEAVTALWEYIRLWNLQEDEEKRNFRCDDLLKKVGNLTRGKAVAPC